MSSTAESLCNICLEAAGSVLFHFNDSRIPSTLLINETFPVQFSISVSCCVKSSRDPSSKGSCPTACMGLRSQPFHIDLAQLAEPLRCDNFCLAENPMPHSLGILLFSVKRSEVSPLCEAEVSPQSWHESGSESVRERHFDGSSFSIYNFQL